MPLARLSGGPLDGQVLAQDADAPDTLIIPYGEGQLVYRRAAADGPAGQRFDYVEATEQINPDLEGQRD